MGTIVLTRLRSCTERRALLMVINVGDQIGGPAPSTQPSHTGLDPKIYHHDLLHRTMHTIKCNGAQLKHRYKTGPKIVCF